MPTDFLIRWDKKKRLHLILRNNSSFLPVEPTIERPLTLAIPLYSDEIKELPTEKVVCTFDRAGSSVTFSAPLSRLLTAQKPWNKFP